MRVVSLLPSATEILFAIGAGDQVVGVTFECDHPPEARERTIVSTSALPPDLPPEQIDAVVRARLAAGEDLYHLDRGAMAGLEADLVVTQDLCAVCAVDVSEVNDALGYLGCTAEVLTTDPHTLDEVLDSVRAIGRAVGCEEAASVLVASARTRIEEVCRKVAGRPPVPTLLLEWIEPPFAPGHWVPEMVRLAGGEPVLGTAGAPSTRTSWERVHAAAPQVVVGAPCGFGLERAAELTAGTRSLPDGIPVWAVDANASFARPGPRLVDGIEVLAAILHPDVCGPPDPLMGRRVR
ncbi:MAG TPA: cobalamin-binding protein [Segeticoccus sp.]|uniref:cobalamin-binding protein n=1 Tax=Segeticoccus sp. TaxID=2706531 RepID=UPI002D7E1CC5|nr:cobalamin-binding protein [Segeticoccus sp.]HET8598763.1 cobalamin-binding protein [Segeticoccus sp.]